MTTSRTADHTDVVKTALHMALDDLPVLDTTVPHYERVGANREMPYQVNGPISMNPSQYVPGGGYKGSQRFEVQIDSFSSWRSDKQIDEIRNQQAQALLTDNALTLPTGYALTNSTLVNSTVLSESEGNHRHGILEVRLAIQIL